jgi:hypothetical protein
MAELTDIKYQFVLSGNGGRIDGKGMGCERTRIVVG